MCTIFKTTHFNGLQPLQASVWLHLESTFENQTMFFFSFFAAEVLANS